MLSGRLGPDYHVWDQSATIRFVRPGGGRVHCTMALPEDRIAGIVAEAAGGAPVRPEFRLEILDEAGEVVAEVDKQLYVRLRRERRPATTTP